jgi:hypothetical protein
MLGDERVVEASEAIDVLHHARWAMKDLKEVSKQFLGPAADLVDGTSVLQNFLDSTAIAEPEEFGAPQKFAVLANGPAPAASLAHKRMVVAFAFGAAAGAKANRPQAGSMQSKVKGADALRTKESESDFGSLGIVGLHENPAHAGTSPIDF